MTTTKQSSGIEIINPCPTLYVIRPTSNTTMEHQPHVKNVQEDNHDHPQREGRNRGDHPQETSQQFLNEDRTIKNWDEGLNLRIIREHYELFVHHDLLDGDTEEDFEDLLIVG